MALPGETRSQGVHEPSLLPHFVTHTVLFQACTGKNAVANSSFCVCVFFRFLIFDPNRL